jgi:ribonuclease BN (tRNA processing enzyme)
MKLRFLASSPQNATQHQYVTTCLINRTVAIDAGCVGFYANPQEQETIHHVFLTHSHIDHIASLPIFVENTWTPSGRCPCVYGSRDTLDGVRRHIFNNVISPDFVALSEQMPPFLHLCPLQAEIPVAAAGLRITPVWVNHVVPTFGYVISDDQTAVIIAGDSGPTTRLWEVAHKTAHLRAIFLETCFPNSMKRLAEVTLHLTPEMFHCEVAKMPAGIKVVAVHLKVRYREEVIRELKALDLPNLEILQCEREYDL